MVGEDGADELDELKLFCSGKNWDRVRKFVSVGR